MYPELMVIPMREELVRAGIEETRTAEEVDAALAQPGTTMVVVNSICGCAAGKMRPGVRMALANSANLPDRKITVFAGQDREATERARSYFEGNPPTSPAVAILRDGKLVYLMQRFVIEQSTAQQIAGRAGARFRGVLRNGDCVAGQTPNPERRAASRAGGRSDSLLAFARSVAFLRLWQRLHLAVLDRVAKVDHQPEEQPANHHLPGNQRQVGSSGRRPR